MTDTTFASLFSGCGCLDLGLERAGMRCIYQCEWERHARAVLRYRFPGIPLAGDITLVEGDDIPQADVWAFGSPCKEFARCNKSNRSQGLSGSQSGLAWQVVRLLREKRPVERPSMLLWENVGSVYDKTYAEGLESWFEAFGDLGYPEVQAFLLRGPDVSVPQLRPRWFTLLSPSKVDFAGLKWAVDACSAFDLLNDDDGDLMSEHWRGEYARKLRRVWGEGKTEKVVARYQPILDLEHPEPALFTGNLSWSPSDGYSPTLDCTGQAFVYKPEWGGIRTLTPVERERLTGLPEDWTEVGDYEPWPRHSDKLKRSGGHSIVPKGQRIKMTGNGVIVQVAELMGRLMLANINVKSEVAS